MKTRIFIVLALFLSLTTCGHRSSENCDASWTRDGNVLPIPQGIGVNIHFTDPQPGEIKMIADAGVRWVRMDFKWDATEKQQGVYDFSAYDRLMTALESRGIRALFILDYGNPLYDNGAPPRSDGAQKAFARWAVAAAKHFAGHDVLWEIYNEPNQKMFWPPSPNANEYVVLALAVGRAIRSEAPTEKLIGPATSTIDFPFLESCFKAGLLQHWSAVSVHPYRQSDPETAAADYCRLRKLINSYSSAGDSEWAMPIISGEWGYSSAWRGMSEAKQGELIARELLTNAANDIQVSIWYDWHDDGTDPAEPEHHFGLVRNAYKSQDQAYDPKPAYLAVTTLTTFFEGYSFERRIPIGSDNDYALVFARGADERIAAWTSSTGHRITLPIGAGSFSGIKHTGEHLVELVGNQQGITVEVSNAPIYLRRLSSPAE